MPEYIDKEKLIASVVNTVTGATETTHDFLTGSAYRQNEIIDIIKEQPAAEVAEVKHGEWKPKHYEGGFMDGTNFEECSICRYRRYFDDIRFKLTFDYCPKCGAKMDGKEGAENVS